MEPRKGTKDPSANLLIVLIVGTVVGALTGLGLGGYFGNQLYLAILAGFSGRSSWRAISSWRADREGQTTRARLCW
jgi:hypothetical protein